MNWIKNISLFISSLVLMLLCLELVLRFFPVTEVIRDQPLSSDAHPLDVSSAPNKGYDYSRLWNFQNARTRRTNSQGFFSDFDYDERFNGIAVIGDSFVSALQVDFEDTFHQLIGSSLKQRVYNFGIDGSPMSQYEAYLSEVCELYEPRKVVIPIITNDFEESLYSHRKDNGFFGYRDGGVLEPTPYDLGLLRRAANRSSLIRYLYFHLGAGVWIRQFTDEQGSKRSVQGVDKDYSYRILAADYFLENMAGYCLQPDNIIFVVDPLRNERGVYGDGAVVTYMRYFIESAEALGYTLIDLHTVMSRDFEKNGRRFEFPFDDHWNRYGHRIVAEALLDILKN